MSFYHDSKKMFKNKIKENKNISKEEWDKFAKDNYLFSANTLMFHNDSKSFEDLKEKLS